MGGVLLVCGNVFFLDLGAGYIGLLIYGKSVHLFVLFGMYFIIQWKDF